MDNSKHKLILGWIEKAWNQIQIAKEHLKSYNRCTESIEASQLCIELSVKSILSFLEIQYPHRHGWNQEDISKIAKQIRDTNLINKLEEQNYYWCTRLPRLVFIANFWAQFYLPAKYGYEAEYFAPPQDLFERQEAEFAIKHAEECFLAVSELRYLNVEDLNKLLEQ